MQPNISFPSTPNQYVAPRGRRKVPLGKGFGMLDWQRHVTTLEDPTLRPVTIDEVATHCTAEDAWMVIKGVVYDITKYLPFHPGGIPILEPFFGKNGTQAFLETHSFVNIEMILRKYAIGMLVIEKQE